MTDDHISHYRDDASSGKAENENLPLAADLVKEIDRLQKQLKNQSDLINLLSTRAVIAPDEFMSFDVFCQIMGVTKREYKPLLASLQSDQEFYEVSEQTRRLFGKTGITHLFKIRDTVAKQSTSSRRKAR